MLICPAVLETSIREKTMAAEEETLVEVHDVTVQRVKGNTFRVTANGVVRTSGWVVNLHPVVYIKPPENWMIDAVGIKPTGIVKEVISPWEASVEMNLSKETIRISVRGMSLKGEKQMVTEAVPW
jgi:hypothetical protein